MEKIESVDIKNAMFEIIKTKFVASSFWKLIEAEIAILCSDLIEPTTPEKVKQFTTQLKQIKVFFLGNDVDKNELTFLDEEIERFEETKNISLYEEKDDEVTPEEIESFARHGGTTEGVVGIHLPFNYAQLERLTNGVFKKTGLIKFYISRETTVYGKIVAEIYEHSQEIPIAKLVESKKLNKDTGEAAFRKILLFGNKTPGREFINVKEINIPFYVYRFITEANKEMILMSPTPCEIGDYIITGVLTTCDDYKMLTDSAKLPTKLPFFFAQNVMNRIIKFKDHRELNLMLNNLKIDRERFFEYPFTIKKGDNSYKTIHPEWYKLLIWSWLTHQPKGLFNNYPMHLMIMGPKHSGKSLLLNGLHAKSKETRDIFSGSSSTLKSLIPSFKHTPAKLGYLAEANRFAFCDEFFRCLINTRTTKDSSQKEESVALMNDLLEHQKRRAGSGVSSVNVNMTSRVLATTNPIKGMSNITDLINSFDESFLSRWLIYNQTDEQISLIRHSNDSDLEKFNVKIAVNDWVAILDYLHSFSAEYDMEKVDEIHASIPKVLNETLNRHYDARHKHHIECLLDGIIKSRCILDWDMSFKANEEDYKNLKMIWTKLISSWINPGEIRKMDIKDRINYLPESCQFIYWKLVEFKKSVHLTDLKSIALKSMRSNEFYDSYMILRDNCLITETENIVRPYFMEDKLDEGQQSL